MPRPIPTPKREDLPEEDLEAYDRIVGRQRVHRTDLKELPPDAPVELGPYHAALATSPSMGVLISEMGRVCRMRADHDGTFSHSDREWVDQVLCNDYQWNGFLVGHTLDGVSSGVRLDAIEALRAGREDDLTHDERLLTTYIRQVVSGTVTDETWAAMEKRLGLRGAIDYTIWITFLNLILRLFQAFGAPDVTDEDVQRVIDGIREGSIAVPDFRERIN
jgi:hypothetical protein